MGGGSSAQGYTEGVFACMQKDPPPSQTGGGHPNLAHQFPQRYINLGLFNNLPQIVEILERGFVVALFDVPEHGLEVTGDLPGFCILGVELLDPLDNLGYGILVLLAHHFLLAPQFTGFHINHGLFIIPRWLFPCPIASGVDIVGFQKVSEHSACPCPHLVAPELGLRVAGIPAFTSRHEGLENVFDESDVLEPVFGVRLDFMPEFPVFDRPELHRHLLPPGGGSLDF